MLLGLACHAVSRKIFCRNAAVGSPGIRSLTIYRRKINEARVLKMARNCKSAWRAGAVSMQHSGVWQIICLFYSILLIYCCVQYFKLSRGTHFVLSFSWHCLFRHSGKFFVLSFSWHCLFRHSGKFFFSYRLCALGPMDGQGGRLGCNSSLVGHTSKWLTVKYRTRTGLLSRY